MTAAHLGIDPGASGALCALDAAGEVLGLYDLPTIVTTTNRKQIDPAGLADLLRQWPGVPCCVERVGPRPNEGAVGGFSFGFGFGVVLTALAVLGHPTRLVQPATWKKWAGIPAGSDKQASIAVAGRLMPSATPHLTLKRHHDRADAALIASYGLRHP